MKIRGLINFFRKTFLHKRNKCTYVLDINLKYVEKKHIKVAGIVDCINKYSKADLLIIEALRDGMGKVIIYSCIEDPKWYYFNIEPLIKKFPEKIFFAGSVNSKQFLFDTISDVYVYADSPAYKEIREESRLTNTSFHEI